VAETGGPPTCQSDVKRNALSSLAGWLSLSGVGMRKNGRKRSIRVLKMRARRRDPAGARVTGSWCGRCHDGIMTDRLSIAVQDGEMRGTRRTAGHRAMSPNGSDDAMGNF
jgi:hypothetical protein